MPLAPHLTRMIRDKRERGQSIAVIACQMKISRDVVRSVLASTPVAERHGFTSELLPGISQMSDEDANLARQPKSEADEEYVNEKVWSIAGEIRQAAMEKRKSEVGGRYA